MRTDQITMDALDADPDAILAHLRRTEPVAWIPALEMWFVTRWDDVAEVEADPERFTAATEPSFLARTLGPNLLTCDPPEHTRLQKIMQAPFLAGGLGGDFVEERLPALAESLLDEIDTTAPFDLMTEYAQPLSAGALAIMLGLDSHGLDTMWKWCEGLCTDIANFENDPERAAIGAATKAELGDAIAAHIEAADAGTSDALSWFVRDGATPEEIVNNVRLMISGGINEPRDGIGMVAWVLLSRPDLRTQVEAEPRLLRRLIEEVFRVHSPVGTVTRQATRDTELAGVQIAKGDLVSGVLRSVNLDEEHWTNPAEIDLHRREGSHAAFALGAHRCLGEWLGRQEVRVGVDRLMQRFPELRMDPDHQVELHGFEFRGPRAVMVRAD